MPEYEMPVEEQLKILVRKFAAFEATLDEQFQKVYERFDKVDEQFDKVDEQFDKVDERFDNVDERLDRIEIRLDDTHAIAKIGLEAVDGLRESMNQKFAATEKKQKEEIELLKTVIVHVRKRVEIVERKRRS